VDRKLAKSGGQLDELLAACWQETADAGPYTFEADRPDWSKVLLGDRFYALIRVRCATYGPDYGFSVICSDPRCRARIDWEVDLRELPVRPLPEESRKLFLEGNRFPTLLPDANRHVTFRLLVGEDERRLPNLRRQAADRILSASLGYRITSIEGVEPKDKKKFLEDLPDVLRGAEGRAPFRGGLLDAEESAAFPDVGLDTWREAVFQLAWQQHGGSGLVMTRAEVLELPLAERDWLLERVADQRTREAKALQSAAKKGR